MIIIDTNLHYNFPSNLQLVAGDIVFLLLQPSAKAIKDTAS